MVPLSRLCHTTIGSKKPLFTLFWPIEDLGKAI